MKTFDEALAELNTLADGKYRSIGFSLTINQFGGVKTECRFYIAGHGFTTGETWEIALYRMRNKLFPLALVDAMEMAPHQTLEVAA